MFSASLTIWTVSSTFTSVWVPTISIGLPPPVELVPYPPRMTFIRERFIAWCVKAGR